MEKEFIPYEQALALKELGFDEPCFGAWVNNELFITENEKPKIQSLSINQCTAPLYQQAFRWFRDEHKLHGWVSFNYENENYKWELDTDMSLDSYDTYEEAELACLKKLIEIVEPKSE